MPATADLGDPPYTTAEIAEGLFRMFTYAAAWGTPDFALLDAGPRDDFATVVKAGTLFLGSEELKRLALARGLAVPDAVLADLTLGDVKPGRPLPEADRERLAGLARSLWPLVCKADAADLAGGPSGHRSGNPGDPTPPAGRLAAAATLAGRLGLDKRYVDTVLRQFAKRNRDCREEVPNPRKGEPRYLYRTADVWPELLRLRNRRLTTD